MYLKRKIYQKLLSWKEESRLTLEVTGARQVGKTYIIRKFADENFAYVVYINMLEASGQEFLDCIRTAAEWKPGTERPEQPLHEAFSLYTADFRDTEETVVIIDEIQESPTAYNLIREFTRNFRCRFIVTGSYLGRTLNAEFKMSAGDLKSLRIETLDFEEFTDAFGLHDTYENMELYGTGHHEDFTKLSELFALYLEIGGYPAVVTEYLETASTEKSREKLEDVIHLFCTESVRYFDDILDAAVYDNIFCSVARILIREKKGLDQDNFSESLQKLVVHDYNSNISKSVCNRAIMWMQSAGILDFAGKVTECRIMDFKGRCRCYFTDLGLAYYFFRKIGAVSSEVQGMLHENFIFLELRRRAERLKEIALETPAFATYKGGEIDFLVKSLLGKESLYALEVKSGKNAAPTGQRALEDGKVDYLLLLKGGTQGGQDGKIITIPVFLFQKFEFTL
ncbi:MAG: AAA family ATPase [Lachnospiraceae bacterium]|nr:AAA family ATPase [Lachnospiraceae bacterium]